MERVPGTPVCRKTHTIDKLNTYEWFGPGSTCGVMSSVDNLTLASFVGR